ncbi:MAG: prolipoprotein diacylglyceryl transferase [Deltaproteobacteria bacterium]|nr:prolipoprotein diacylglyceryl transferase [Deltaproteobacteria bacterium]
MHPILFHIGDIPVFIYGVQGALGFIVVTLLILRRSRALFLNRDKVVDVIFWTSITAVVGARAVFVYQNLDALQGVGDWVNIRAGGLVFYGALLTGLPVGALLVWRHRLPFYAFTDVVATALPISHAISRLGCLAAGCCYGTPSVLPWAVTYSHPLTDAPHGVSLHPTQLYAALYLFAIGAACNWFYNRKSFDGQVMWLYLVLYAVARSLNEVVRGDVERGWFLEDWLGQTLTTSQGLSILLACAALGVFWWGARRAKAARSAKK